MDSGLRRINRGCLAGSRTLALSDCTPLTTLVILFWSHPVPLLERGMGRETRYILHIPLCF